MGWPLQRDWFYKSYRRGFVFVCDGYGSWRFVYPVTGSSVTKKGKHLYMSRLFPWVTKYLNVILVFSSEYRLFLWAEVSTKVFKTTKRARVDPGFSIGKPLETPVFFVEIHENIVEIKVFSPFPLPLIHHCRGENLFRQPTIVPLGKISNFSVRRFLVLSDQTLLSVAIKKSVAAYNLH